MTARTMAYPSTEVSEDVFGFGSPFSYLGLGLSEEFAITNLLSNRVVLCPPGLFLRTSRRGGEHELPPGLIRLHPSQPEMVVVKDTQRLDHVGDCDPAVADEEQVFPVFLVRRRGEVV